MKGRRMTPKSKKIIACATLAGVVAALSGCQSMRPEGRKTGITDNDVYPYDNGKIDPYVELVLNPPGGPSPSDGTLGIPVGLFLNGNNGQSCFPTSAGWDRYYVTFYFLGPNVSPPPNPNNYPNPENLASVTVDTLLTANGANLDTGIVILDNLNPASKVCNDNTPSFASNTNLSSATFTPTGSGKKYRVTIFYKSSTLGGLSEVKMHWKYP